MHIDVTSIRNSKELELKFELLDNLEFFNVHLGELKFKEPVFLKGTISNVNDKFLLKGRIKTKIQLNCSCCNKPVDRIVDLPINEIFGTDDNEQDDIWKLSGNIVELNPVIISNIALDIPMKILCRNDCKGLCPKCGHDLNEYDCECNITELDPRFEKLKFFFNNEEV